MPVELYNEGRVVGYSAYEIYVRHALSIDPNTPPASEREWLSASIATGASMLVRVDKDSVAGPHYRDIQFPSNCRLCAANTIIASFFSGAGHVPNGSDWATKVTDYGQLISNNTKASPSGRVSEYGNIPTQDIKNWPASTKKQLREYIKVLDGIIIQPGTWESANVSPPAKDFSPDLSATPKLRLFFSDAIDTPFFILLTGFTLRTVVQGVCGTDSSIDTASPQDGDFLGPAAYPWSAKVILSIPPAFVNYFLGNSYSRRVPTTEEIRTVKSSPVIDMTTTDPSTYYSSHDTNSKVAISVTDLNTYGDGAAVLTVFQRDAALPPALFGTYAAGVGGNYLYPLDTVAPGTIKLYSGDVHSVGSDTDTDVVAKAKSLESTTPNNTALMRDSRDYVLHELNKDTDQVIPVAKVFTNSLVGALVITEMTCPLFMVEGSYPRSGVVVSMYNGSSVPDAAQLFNDPSKWYITYNNTKISGAAVAKDPLPYCPVSPIIHKRITGKLSEAIRKQCGYEYDSGVFDSGGIWSKANTNMVNQIPEAQRKDYYYIIPGRWSSSANNIVWPVRKSDHMLDVTVRYGFQIYINGKTWEIPPFYNSELESSCSDYLGSWWSGGGLAADKQTATKYSNKWANIFIEGHSHPTVRSRISTDTSGQAYYPDALLPADIRGVPYETYAKHTSISNIFGANVLSKAGIHSQYHHYSILGFLRTALYTDMGTGKLLPSANTNILQPQRIYTNGYNAQTGQHVGADIKYLFALTVANTKANSGKAQLMEVPEHLLDIDTSDPLGVVTQTGQLQTMALSMADRSNQPYPLAGTGGIITDTRGDTLHWDDLVTALSQNKSIDVLGDNLRAWKSQLAALSSGNDTSNQYALKFNGNTIALSKIQSEFPEFFMYSISTNESNSGGVNPYPTIKLDVFGYTSSNSPQTVNTYGTITLNTGSTSLNVSNTNWFQRFTITGSNLTALKSLVKALSRASGITSYNTLKLSIVPRVGYISTTSHSYCGAPRSASMVLQTCYIDLTNLNSTTSAKGIVYVRNDGGAAWIASGSHMCSYGLSNDVISYEPSGWTWSN